MTDKKTSPSAFMRQLRPENYSDTTEVVGYLLDQAVFDHHLETLTSRNQTHDFEIFCRKLCERAVCPNLRPTTGPDGGGDSKADTETVPVADEITSLTYVGEANAGREKWAFAFSAKKDWRTKARSDVKGIAETERGYKRIIFVTSQYAKAKPRADLEKALTDEYGIEVTIHDRSWIIQQVIEQDRKDLAHNYLHVGQEVSDASNLGPADYSHKRQLEAIEKLFDDPSSFAGMERQGITEAMLAASLSRTLERPRTETEGRYQRAVRLADQYGTHRQKLEARYERIWTAVWWFDDYAELNANYAAFEAKVINDDHAINLEFLSNLLQMLFNAVTHGDLTRAEADLDARSSRLCAQLEKLGANSNRPTNSLEARTLLTLLRLNLAMLAKNVSEVPSFWPEFANILDEAKGLGEYDATRLVRLIEAVGGVAGDDPAYNALVEQMSEFVTERTGEAQGAQVLLSRAQKLDLNSHYQIIRLLGKAARQLTKKEYTDKLIEALYLLSLAYRRAGLFWAARATCIFAGASIAMDGEADSQIDVTIVPTMELLAWTSRELRHLPDFLQAVRVLNGCLRSLPLADESKTLLKDKLQTLDMALASNFLNATPEELRSLEALPDVLEALELFTARFGLLYALGYEEVLRADGSMPAEESDDGVKDMVKKLASLSVSNDIRGPLITNRPGARRLESSVMGMTAEVTFESTATSTAVAEAVLASVEACFATALELRVHPHTELYSIELVEDAQATEPSFTLDPLKPQAKLLWPKGRALTAYDRSADTIRFLTQVALMTMAGACVWHDGKETIEKLAENEAVFDRVTTISITPNSYHRLFSEAWATLDDYADIIKTTFPLKEDRPVITREQMVDDEKEERGPDDPKSWWKGKSHRDLKMLSVIDYNLWNQARWSGTLYTQFLPQMPPGIGLMFQDEAAARGIFERWRERFGNVDREDDIYLSMVRDVSDENPAHYNVLITSRHNPSDVGRAANAAVISRFNRMQPDTDANLRRFLDEYEKAGVFLLFPAVMTDDGPKVLSELAILKRNLVIKSAKTLGPGDVEQCCVGERADRHFEETDVAPSSVAS